MIVAQVMTSFASNHGALATVRRRAPWCECYACNAVTLEFARPSTKYPAGLLQVEGARGLMGCTPSGKGWAAVPAADRAKQIFPNLKVELQGADVGRSLRSRMVGNQALAHLDTPLSLVHACGKTAAGAGFGAHFKLIWQLAGKMRYEDADRSLILTAGEMIIIPMAWTYQLAMAEHFEALVLVFDPAAGRNWRDTVHQQMGRAIPGSGAIAASAAGAEALLRYGRSDDTDVLAVQSLVDMAIAPLEGDRVECGSEQPSTAGLFHARLLIAQNIGDESYGPDQLARDLGLSRRSLYNLFEKVNLTPARFIRYQRLARARAEILRDPGRQTKLVTIALRNGFSDSSSFSRLFKAAYGVAPSELRHAQATR